jgi:polysaccharide biosynthesis protein PelE
LAPASGSGAAAFAGVEMPGAETLKEPTTSTAFNTGDPDSWMLYGRILLEADDLVQAGQAFAQARRAGIGEQKIAPWLAEIAFRERKFEAVRRYLSARVRAGEKGRDLALVTAWWNK